MARQDFSPYGELMRSAGLPLTIGYTGHMWDRALGQYFAPFRYYNPATARWNMRDPLGFVDGPNVYAYVVGNPVSFLDSSGLSQLPMDGGLCWPCFQPLLPPALAALGAGAATLGGILTAPVSVPVIVGGIAIGAAVGAILGTHIYQSRQKNPSGGKGKANDLGDKIRGDMAENPQKPGESGSDYADRLYPNGPYGPKTPHNQVRKYCDRKPKKK